MERIVNISTGKITERQLTSTEVEEANTRTAAEIAAKEAEADPDADFQSDLETTDEVIAAVTDPGARAALQALSDVMKGKGPTGAKVKGRK